MPLELESLQKSVTALDLVWQKSNDPEFMNGLDAVAVNAIKSGVIQHFEFTYELCWKFIKRWLEMNISTTAADGATRRELFRMAAENLLIDDVEQWMRHHDARNKVSHTYQPEIAESVCAASKNFVEDAKKITRSLGSQE